MKHMKTYENRVPKIGDYALFIERDNYENDKYDDMCAEFILNNVGKIINIDYYRESNNELKYLATYKNIPKKIKNYFDSFGTPNSRGFYENELVEFVKNKIDLEAKISAKKYNL